MSNMKDLDLYIKQKSKSKKEYRLLKHEINQFMNDIITFAKLSPKAQLLLVEFSE